MKVKELLDALVNANPNAEVILQKDSEGNGYSPLRGADLEAVYKPESTWSGSVYSLKWSAVEAGMEPKDWKKLKSEPTCVVLYPVN